MSKETYETMGMGSLFASQCAIYGGVMAHVSEHPEIGNVLLGSGVGLVALSGLCLYLENRREERQYE